MHPNEGGALKNKSSELLQNATNDARDIFPYRLSKIKAFWKLSLAKIGDFFGYQTAFAKGEEGLYSKRGIKRIVENYLGDALLGDSFSTVFIPAATVKRNQKQDSHLYFFSSQNPMHKGLKMKDIARATTAAPLIFASHKIKELFPITTSDGEVEARFVDGGLIANNPTKLAYEEASRLFEGPLRFLIVSIGTGENELDLSKPTNVMEMFSCTMRRQSELTHNDLNVIFKNRELGIYKRLQFVLEQKISLEDTRDETLAYLARVGEDGIKNVHAKDIKEIVDILKQKRTYGTPGKLILKPKSFDEDLENNTSCDR
ncbi:MAG: patatin-like phospholipase family protein [Flavobacteriales bacterium]|nr:patatin-like phospholipase family protein [Flavobacteriales bacterium]